MLKKRNDKRGQSHKSVNTLKPITTLGGGIVGGTTAAAGIGLSSVSSAVVGVLGVTIGATVLAVPILAGIGVGSWVMYSLMNRGTKPDDEQSVEGA